MSYVRQDFVDGIVLKAAHLNHIEDGILELENAGGGGQGPTGPQGPPGVPGYTPQKGIDYYTDADKAEMVEDVLAALPVAEGGSF